MLNELLARSARLFPGRAALVEGSRAVRYGELLDVVEAMSGHLSEWGLPAGETVALQMPNSIRSVVALFAVGRLGATLLLLDPALKAGEVDDYCQRAGARTLLLSAQGPGKVAEGGPCVRFLPPLESLGDGGQHSATRSVPNGGHGPLLFLSSGTTGPPKPVVVTAAQAAAYVRSCDAACAYTQEDKVLAVLPFFHAFGLLHMLLPALANGGVVIVAPFFPRSTAAAIERERITVLAGVPLMFRLLAETEFHQQPDFSSIRLAISGGAALSLGVTRRFQDKYGVAIGQSYGTTEAGLISFAPPGEQVEGPGFVGRPYPGVTVEIRSPSGDLLGPGAGGEICVRSPASASGYVGEPADGTGVFRKDCVGTGDIGCLDEAGRLFLMGRAKPMLNVAGKKVSPTEVEACLRGHPSVADVLVVGAKTPDGGERAKAFVVPVGPVTVLELQEFCATKLAAYKVPRQIAFVKDLSGGAMGKTRTTAPDATEG
jgi:long-chain acyl-CoA synthetase